MKTCGAGRSGGRCYAYERDLRSGDPSGDCAYHGLVNIIVAEGIVQVKVERTYPLAQARRAHEDLQARRISGAGILVP